MGYNPTMNYRVDSGNRPHRKGLTCHPTSVCSKRARCHKSEITLGGKAARNAFSTASTSMTSCVIAPLTGLR